MLSSGLFVVHDAVRRGQDDVAKLTRWQQVLGPGLDRVDGHIKSGADHSAFVQASVQVDDDLAGSVVVDDLELANVAVLHHHCEELDRDFGARSQEHLTLVLLLGIVEGLESIGQ